MLKKILIAVIAVILVVIIAGLYFLVVNYGKVISPSPQSGGSSASFNIQGMKVEVLKQGSGTGAKAGDYVTAHYVGTLSDGKEFDSSVKRSAPFTFQLGQEKVIKGWDLGVAGMKVGEERRLTIPPELAYGLDGFPPTIPQKATLTYVIDLLKISPAPVK